MVSEILILVVMILFLAIRKETNGFDGKTISFRMREIESIALAILRCYVQCSVRLPLNNFTCLLANLLPQPRPVIK